ncbi:MAG: hypothetical protein DIZ80_17035 [endosymbiont of Galathealinum brachiosum]|uniref:Transcriptional regulator n=1 Tax=endosymbiont of Galathealinum brachiosum TaxID=2200906 RepID=A0A370D6T3_9GAMM|nr:MAG: hypothetical protein DIZ80_17035 [endosymbiont of Galathealinum brachiosum]
MNFKLLIKQEMKMKTLSIIAAVAAITVSTSANAWFGNNGSNNFGNMNNNGFGNGNGAANGDFDSSFSFGMSGKANGRGNGNGYNAYNGNNAYNGSNGYYQQPQYGYAPAPLTKEQIEEQRAIAEKAQKEAAERYQEMVKNAPKAPAFPVAQTQPQPFQPAAFDQQAMIKKMEEQRAQMMKMMEERRKEAEARHQDFLKQVKDARATKVETQKS